MAVSLDDVIERNVSALEGRHSTSGEAMFPMVRTALYPVVKKAELELNLYGTSGTSGAPQPLPHTLASFVWFQPVAIATPGTQTYTLPILRPSCNGYLHEAMVEVGIPSTGGDTLIELYKNGVKFGELTILEGEYTARMDITGSVAVREFYRDDYFAYKITESCTNRARGLTVYIRFYQYPYVMNDAQDPLPMP